MTTCHSYCASRSCLEHSADELAQSTDLQMRRLEATLGSRVLPHDPRYGVRDPLGPPLAPDYIHFGVIVAREMVVGPAELGHVPRHQAEGCP